MNIINYFVLLSFLGILLHSCADEDLRPQPESPVVKLDELFLPGPEPQTAGSTVSPYFTYWVFISSPAGELLIDYAINGDTVLNLPAEITALDAFHVSWGSWSGTDCVPCTFPMTFETLTNVHCHTIQVGSEVNFEPDHRELLLEFTDIDLTDIQDITGAYLYSGEIRATVPLDATELPVLLQLTNGTYYLGRIPLEPQQAVYAVSFADAFRMEELEVRTIRFSPGGPTVERAFVAGYTDDCHYATRVLFPRLEPDADGNPSVGIPSSIAWSGYQFDITHPQGEFRSFTSSLRFPIDWEEPEVRIESGNGHPLVVRHSNPGYSYEAIFSTNVTALNTHVHWRIYGDLLSPVQLPPFPEVGLLPESIESLRSHHGDLRLQYIEGYQSSALADYVMRVVALWGPPQSPVDASCEPWQYRKRRWEP